MSRPPEVALLPLLEIRGIIISRPHSDHSDDECPRIYQKRNEGLKDETRLLTHNYDVSSNPTTKMEEVVDYYQR
jgi:hypothetical protein